jgi:hypothetical protein
MSVKKLCIVALRSTLIGLALLSERSGLAQFPIPPVTGFDGIELLAFGPGGDFGSDLYVATAGSDSTLGGIFTVSRSGKVTPFISGFRATSVAFDTSGVLGGGMFFGDFGEKSRDAGKIRRVTRNSQGQFETTLFADLANLPGNPKVFQLTISSGQNGFAPGLYVTSGPLAGPRSDRLFRVDATGQVSVVMDGFNSNESLVFAQGAYGDGLLISEPREQRILRLLSDGTISTFATLGTAPFGPADITYGDDGMLYTTDFAGNRILRLLPDGSSTVYGSVSQGAAANSAFGGAKAIERDGVGGFIVGEFTDDPIPTGNGSLTPVPEPSSFLLLSAGFCGLLVYVWIHRRVTGCGRSDPHHGKAEAGLGPKIFPGEAFPGLVV